MTARFAEELLYEGEPTSMCTAPPADDFAASGRKPQFRSESTVLWRGHVGSREVVDGRLYLVGLHGTMLDGNESGHESVFLGQHDRHHRPQPSQLPSAYGRFRQPASAPLTASTETEELLSRQSPTLQPGTRARREHRGMLAQRRSITKNTHIQG